MRSSHHREIDETNEQRLLSSEKNLEGMIIPKEINESYNESISSR